MNLRYNGNKHWVTSFQFENGDIYLLDSYLGTNMKDSLNDSLKIQLAQIYGYGKTKLNVKIDKCLGLSLQNDINSFSMQELP